MGAWQEVQGSSSSGGEWRGERAGAAEAEAPAAGEWVIPCGVERAVSTVTISQAGGFIWENRRFLPSDTGTGGSRSFPPKLYTPPKLTENDYVACLRRKKCREK